MVRDGPGRGRSKTRRRTHGGRASAPPIASTTGAPSAAATVSTTRTSRSISSSGSRRSGSRRTPWRRTRRTASSRRSSSIRDSRPAPFSSRRSSIPTFGLGTAPIAVAKDGLTLPRFQNWSITYERELTSNMMVDVSYIGNHGSRLNHHWQTLGVDANMNSPSVLSLGTAVLQSDINSDLARQAGIQSPYPGFSGNVAQALRKYPQYQNIIWRGVPTGESQYHALELVLERRFSHGLQWRVGYTYSTLHNNGAESAQGDNGVNGSVQDPANPLPWGLSGDDTPHVFLTGFTWELPGPSGGLSEALLAGWHVSGILRYESGRPLNITMNNDLGGLLFNGQKRPNRVSGTDARRRIGRLRSDDGQLLQSGRLDGSGTAPVRQCAAGRRNSAGVPQLQRGHQHLQGIQAERARRSSASRWISVICSTGRCSAIQTRTGARPRSGRSTRSATSPDRFSLPSDSTSKSTDCGSAASRRPAEPIFCSHYAGPVRTAHCNTRGRRVHARPERATSR